MRLKAIITPLLFAAALAFSACNPAPKTDVERIDALKKQVQADAKTLGELEANTMVQLQSDFVACDSMLQYLHPEEVDEVFQQLQLVDAYIKQFKETRPTIQTDMDSTLIQLDNLKSDIETHYLSDSLATVYLEAETQHVTRLSNQVQYFKDRFSTCSKDLNGFKKKK